MYEEGQYLHEPPMTNTVIENNCFDFELISDLEECMEYFQQQKESPAFEDEKISIIDLLNEDMLLSKQKIEVDEEYNKIQLEFGNSIPKETNLTNQNKDIEYIKNKTMKEKEKIENIKKKKIKETKKLLQVWKEICTNTPALKDFNNIIDLNQIEGKNNSDLMQYFNDIIDKISSELNK